MRSILWTLVSLWTQISEGSVCKCLGEREGWNMCNTTAKTLYDILEEEETPKLSLCLHWHLPSPNSSLHFHDPSIICSRARGQTDVRMVQVMDDCLPAGEQDSGVSISYTKKLVGEKMENVTGNWTFRCSFNDTEPPVWNELFAVEVLPKWPPVYIFFSLLTFSLIASACVLVLERIYPDNSTPPAVTTKVPQK